MTPSPGSVRSFNPQQIRPRQIEFPLSPEIPRLWFRNSSIMTHLLNGTNLLLPAFESYMVQTAQKQLQQLHDADLRSQVKGLIGQEATHSKAHQQYNEILRQQGYRIDLYLKGMHGFFHRLLPRLGMPLQLAIIAGFEHLTASLSEMTLRYNMLEPAHPALKALWEWHAAEELEHKAIAFDLFQAIDGAYWRRVVGGVLGVVIVTSLMVVGMGLLAIQDPGFVSLRTLADLNKLLFTEYRLVPRGLQRLIPYFQPGFHPSQRDDRVYGELVLPSK